MEQNNNTLESLDTLCTKPATGGLSRGVYDLDLKTMPLSFYNETSYKEGQQVLAVPQYCPSEALNIPTPSNQDQLFKQFAKEADGRLRLIDEDIRSSQSGIITDVLKQAGMSILEGKGMVGVSLPVRIFEPRSTIERVTDVWGYAPYFLNKVAEKGNPVERVKATLAMVVSSLPFMLSQWKPFNPILGETYSAVLEDGTKIECEHTSHHPPVTNYYIT